jgi:hypothetical protein
MDIELLRQFGQRLLTPHGGQGHLCLERRACGSGGFVCSSSLLLGDHPGRRQAETPLYITCVQISGNYPRLVLGGSGVQASTVFRMVLRGDVLEASRAVSTTVRMAASPSAAHIAR